MKNCEVFFFLFYGYSDLSQLCQCPFHTSFVNDDRERVDNMVGIKLRSHEIEKLHI